jgi:hypothetical protein
MKRAFAGALALLLSLSLLGAPQAKEKIESSPAGAGGSAEDGFVVHADGSITAGGQDFSGWTDYVTSTYFREHGLRCGTRIEPSESAAAGNPSDCSAGQTNPSDEYTPGVVYEIPVVVHIIMSSSGQGAISNKLVYSQIDVLNEDYMAIPGTPGEPGTDIRIQFKLATLDGITRTINDTWFNDGGSYWETLARDPVHYLNIYTNSAGGYLGYVPFLPQTGSPGSAADRVVILWSAFGRDAPIGPPYDQGRTATHEIGHYLGLYHTFEGGCASGSPPDCYTSGDRICDTDSESSPTFGCPIGRTTCSSLDPVHNYMDYSDDICMNQFTWEQALRVRCTLENYRSKLYRIVSPTAVPGAGALADAVLRLEPIHPNPTSGTSVIRYALGERADATLTVHDVHGRRVASLVDGVQSAGEHSVIWRGLSGDGGRLPTGEYFVRLAAGSLSRTQKVLLVE